MITLARPGDPNLFEDVDSALGDIVGAGLRVLAQDVFELMPDLADRIKRGARVLKDHGHFATAQITHLRFVRGADIDPGERYRALGDAAGAVEDAHHGK